MKTKKILDHLYIMTKGGLCGFNIGVLKSDIF